MVKHAKLFKERFYDIYQDLVRTHVPDETGLSNKDDIRSVAQLILAELLPSMKKTILSNLNNRTYHEESTDRIILNNYPKLAQKYQSVLDKNNKVYVAKRKKIETELYDKYMQLKDFVIFNGKDPLEAIKELQEYKPE